MRPPTGPQVQPVASDHDHEVVGEQWALSHLVDSHLHSVAEGTSLQSAVYTQMIVEALRRAGTPVE